MIRYIEKEIQDRRPVIIHCNSGSGRTSTILATYLMMKEKMTAEQAVDR
jgi:atypical dual specificity phosphatase